MNRSIFKLINKFSSNLRNFESLEALNDYLATTQPAQNVVYFRANWNPQCRDADRDAELLAAKNPTLQVIRVDTDVSPKIAKHYSVKAEPQFVFCLYGDELLRQIGRDYEGLEKKYNKMQKFAAEATDLTTIHDKWVPYGTTYKVYYEEHIKQEYLKQFRGI